MDVMNTINGLEIFLIIQQTFNYLLTKTWILILEVQYNWIVIIQYLKGLYTKNCTHSHHQTTSTGIKCLTIPKQTKLKKQKNQFKFITVNDLVCKLKFSETMKLSISFVCVNYQSFINTNYFVTQWNYLF